MAEALEADDAVKCQFCGFGPEMEEIAGQLHAESSFSDKIISAHHRCMQYASGLTQYKTDEFGGFDVDDVEKEISRGKKLRCSVCKASRGKKSKGASCGCAVKSCRKTFHYPCAFQDPGTITKRLVVTTNKNNAAKEKCIYYRVFCSKVHEEAFRRALRDELRESKSNQKKRGGNSGDDAAAYSSQEAKPEGENRTDTSDLAHNTSELNSASPATSNRAASLSKPSPAASSDSDHQPKTGVEQSDVASSRHQPRDRGKSGFVQPKFAQLGNHISQSPSSSMTEITTKTRQLRGRPDKSPSVFNSGSSQNIVVMPETQSGVLNAAVIVHDVAKRKHAERESDDTSKASGLEVDFEGTLKDCFVSLESAPTGQEAVSQNSQSNSLNTSFTHDSYCRSPASASGKEPRRVSLRTLQLNPNSSYNVKTMESHSGGSLHQSPNISSWIIGQSSPRSSQCSLQSAQQTTESQSKVSVSQKTCGEGSSSSRSALEKTIGESSMLNVSVSLRNSNRKNESASATEPNICQTDGSKSSRSALDDSSFVDIETETAVGVKSHGRKRKVNDDSDEAVSSKKANRGSETTGTAPQAAVLMIPSNIAEFEQQESTITNMACDALKVKKDSLCVWQRVTEKSLPPELLIFFMLDLVNKLVTGGSEVLLNLFSDEHLSARQSSYVEQAKIFDSLSDEKSQRDVQTAVFDGLERSLKGLSMVRLLRLPDQNVVTLAVGVPISKDNLPVLAYLQAYKGLFRWQKDTEAAGLNLCPADRLLAVQTEAQTWQIWLTKLNPVSEVIVLPTDAYLVDDSAAEAAELGKLVKFLKDSSSKKAADCPEQNLLPLLVFQKVDLHVLRFPEYFRKACHRIFRTRELGNILVLLPLCNIVGNSYESISNLMNDAWSDSSYPMTISSVFCPQNRLTTMVLLQISTASPLHPDSAEPEGQSEITASPVTPQKRGRGRPRKQVLSPQILTE